MPPKSNSPPPSYVSEPSFLSLGTFKSKVVPHQPKNHDEQAEVKVLAPDLQKHEHGTSTTSGIRAALLTECSQSVGIPGIPNLFLAHNIPLKLFWLLANIGCWGLFGYVLYTMTVKFLLYPTVVNTDIRLGSNLEFPAVTVCNLNRVASSRIDRTSKFFGLRQLSNQVTRDIQMQSNDKFSGFSFKVSASDCDYTGGNPTEFYCSDKSNCIEMKRQCDGKMDCNDNSDEVGCPTMPPGGTTTTERPKQNVANMKGIKNEGMYTDIDWDNPDWYDVYSLSNTDDFRDIYPFTYMNRTEVDEWSGQAADFVVTCSFDQTDCDVNRHMHEFLDERYGRCVTFNSPMTERTSDSMLSSFGKQQTSASSSSGNDNENNEENSNSSTRSKDNVLLESTARTGILYGLKMSLWMNVDTYLSLISPAVGAIISIHNPLVEPDLSSSAIVVEPGKYAMIGVKRITITRLAHPYSDCVDEFPDELPIPEEKKGLYSYNQQICIKYCHQRVIKEKCGCYESFITGTDELCDHSQATVTACVFDVYQKISNSEIECNKCPMACYDDFYETAVTTSIWPLGGFVPFFIDYIWKNIPEMSALRMWLDNLIEKNSMDFDSIATDIRSDMARVSVHFESMSYETINFLASYTLIQFIADIGGYMGLFVGVCAMTVFEVVDWIMQLTFCTGRLMR